MNAWVMHYTPSELILVSPRTVRLAQMVGIQLFLALFILRGNVMANLQEYLMHAMHRWAQEVTPVTGRIAGMSSGNSEEFGMGRPD